MTNPTYTVTVKGEALTFTSAFGSLAEAYHALVEGDGELSDFAHDLLDRARQRRLSHKQAAWLHKLATDATKTGPDRFVVEGLELGAVIDMMDRAFGAGKKFPAITFGNLTIKRCGSRSKYEGSANLMFGDEWGGRIGRDGRVFRGKAYAWAEIEASLRELAKDPQQVLAQEGIATGTCCYCNRGLSDKRSRDVGYGPICADRFDLPWGGKADAELTNAPWRAN